MKKYISKSRLKGSVAAPASKSESIRAAIMAIHSEGEFSINNFSKCDDAEQALNVMEMLGYGIRRAGNRVKLSREHSVAKAFFLHASESALIARILSVIGSLFLDDYIVTGSKTLLSRNFSELAQLEKYGIAVLGDSYQLPLSFSGKLSANRFEIEASESSQLPTAIILAMPYLSGESSLRIMQAVSKPYIELTVEMLKSIGIEIEFNDNIVKTYGKQACRYADITVSGDWSSAAYLAAAGINVGGISITGLDMHSIQSDRSILEIDNIKSLFTNDGATLQISSGKANFDFDASDSPDLIPALAAIAVGSEGSSTIKGCRRLVNKESNRAELIVREFSKFGAEIRIDGDTMIISGSSRLKAATIDPAGDHRIAMAAAAIALAAECESVIINAECVSKSYPSFWSDLNSLGANIHE